MGVCIEIFDAMQVRECIKHRVREMQVDRPVNSDGMGCEWKSSLRAHLVASDCRDMLPRVAFIFSTVADDEAGAAAGLDAVDAAPCEEK